jgi:predicted molibdopterin-dependent oxidoreductase YjgC
MVSHALGSQAIAHDQDDILNAGAVLVIGADINGTHNVLGAHLKAAARSKKTRLLVATRLASGLDPFAEVVARIRPGTEAALLVALADDNPGPSATGSELDEDIVRQIRAVLTETQNSVIVWDTGIWTYGQEQELTGAAINLALNTGKTLLAPLPEKANLAGALAAGMAPDVVPGFADLDAVSRMRIEEAWGTDIPDNAGLPIEQLFNGRNLKALYVMGDDLIERSAAPETVRKAVKAADLVIVQDVFPNQMTELADVVLPGTTVAEKDGHFYNFEGRGLEITAASSPFGEARPDWEIAARIAAELGKDYGYRTSADLWIEFNKVAVSCEQPGTQEIQPVPMQTSDTSEALPFLLATETDLFTAGPALRKGKTMSELYPAVIKINPNDASSFGVSDGEQVEIRTQNGRITLPVEVSDTMIGGVAYIPDYLPEAPVMALRPGRPDAVPISIKLVGDKT